MTANKRQQPARPARERMREIVLEESSTNPLDQHRRALDWLCDELDKQQTEIERLKEREGDRG